jgi:hypothetical protein
MDFGEEERVRRRPAVERTIQEISEQDFRVRIIGTVVDMSRESQSIIIDDGTGRAVVFFPDPAQFEEVQEGKLYRVFGKVKKDENIEIEAELIQDMSNLDVGLYEQVRYITEKLMR